MAVALDTVNLNREGNRESAQTEKQTENVEKERETAGHIVQHCASNRFHPVIAQVMAETTYQLEDQGCGISHTDRWMAGERRDRRRVVFALQAIKSPQNSIEHEQQHKVNRA